MSSLILPRRDLWGWHIRVVCRKFADDIDRYRNDYGKVDGETLFFRRNQPYDTEHVRGNLLMTLGADALINGLIGSALTVFSNANAYIGVGDSTTAAAANQTDLQSVANKVRVGMDATYPQHTGGTNSVVFSATFGSAVANFAWNEWAIFNAAAAGVMLNRKVAALGTKATGSWQLQVTPSLS